MTQEVNRTKPPTARDKKIAEYLMNTGKKLHHLDAIQLFRCTSIRDSVYRLRKAGYAIQSERVDYKTSFGEHKHYVNYFIQQENKAA